MYFILFCIFVFSTAYVNAKIENIVSFNIVNESDIEILLTTYSKKVVVPILQTQQYSVLNYSYVKNFDLTPEANVTVTIQDEQYNLSLFFDYIEVNELEFNHFLFYSGKTGISNIIGISLGFNYTNREDSIIHRWHRYNFIEKKIYFINPLEKKLYLGGLPKNIGVNFTTNNTCEVPPSSNIWRCVIKHISLQTSMFIINGYANFDIHQKFVLGSRPFFSFLSRSYFDKVGRTSCDRRDYGFYTCRCEAIKKLGNVTFKIGGIDYVLGPEELFSINSDGVCEFNIRPSKDGNFVLGYTFMKKFGIAFDMENSLINIFKKEGKSFPVEREEAQSPSGIKIVNILIVTMIIEVSGIIIIIINKKQNIAKI